MLQFRIVLTTEQNENGVFISWIYFAFGIDPTSDVGYAIHLVMSKTQGQVIYWTAANPTVSKDIRQIRVLKQVQSTSDLKQEKDKGC